MKYPLDFRIKIAEEYLGLKKNILRDLAEKHNIRPAHISRWGNGYNKLKKLKKEEDTLKEFKF